MDTGFDDALKIANRKHDLIALKIYDKSENELPDVGILKMIDAETGVERWVDTSNQQARTAFKAAALKRQDQINNLMMRAGIDTTSIGTHESYVKPLMELFKRRNRL